MPATSPVKTRDACGSAVVGKARCLAKVSRDLGPAGNMEAYDLAFLDPPYGKGLGDKALAVLVSGNWLKPGAVVVLEERAGTPVMLPGGLIETDRRAWGDTEVRFLRLKTPD